MDEEKAENDKRAEKLRKKRGRYSGGSFSAEIARKKQNNDYAREPLDKVVKKVNIVDKTKKNKG